MILELGIPAIMALGGTTFFRAFWHDHKRLPRPVYGAMVSWWYGGFADETAAGMAATMMDSDLNCDAFKPTDANGYRYDKFLYNESLRLEITYVDGSGRCRVRIKCDKKGWIEIPVSAYDDYYISKAFLRWKERKKEVEFHSKHREAAHLLENRINENYINMIEMVEKRILNSGADTASELRALLPPPEHPDVKVPAKKKLSDDELCDKYDPIYQPHVKKKSVRPPSTTSTTKQLQAVHRSTRRNYIKGDL